VGTFVGTFERFRCTAPEIAVMSSWSAWIYRIVVWICECPASR